MRRLLAITLTLLATCTSTAAAATPPNSGYADQWHLTATGISRAWNLAGTGSASVIVGEVDSGVNFSHAALAGANLWTNPGEIAGNGIDDDNDGCIDDVHGCDFVDGDGDPSDANGHGTATAGVIFSGWGASIRYAGIAPGATLLVARALDAGDSGTTTQLADALTYVADHGARVINVSITGPESSAVEDVIEAHPNALFVVAAGNTSANDDASPAYPCSSAAANVICVAANDQSGALASFSSYGATTVDLAAPGARIATLTLNGYSNGWVGTSIAAPIVAGVAALAFSADAGATPAQVKAAILGTVTADPSLAGRTVSGGRLNAYAAISALTGRTDDTATSAPVATPTSTPVTTTTAGTLTVARRAVAKGHTAVRAKLSCARAACAGTIAVAGSRHATTFSLAAGAKATLSVPVKLTTKTRSVALVTTVGSTVRRVTAKVTKR